MTGCVDAASRGLLATIRLVVVQAGARSGVSHRNRARTCGGRAAGLIHSTDALLSHKVRVAARIPATSQAPVRYSAALARGALLAAREVLEWLSSEPSQAAFRAADFGAGWAAEAKRRWRFAAEAAQLRPTQPNFAEASLWPEPPMR